MQRTFGKDEIDMIAGELLDTLRPGSAATVVALSGDLGAGKTSLSQAIARRLGITENVISPTFVIMKEYPTAKGPYRRLIHIDAYRLESAAELERLGWRDVLADATTVLLIEWPEKVPGAIPNDARRVTLEHLGENERAIEF